MTRWERIRADVKKGASAKELKKEYRMDDIKTARAYIRIMSTTKDEYEFLKDSPEGISCLLRGVRFFNTGRRNANPSEDYGVRLMEDQG